MARMIFSDIDRFFQGTDVPDSFKAAVKHLGQKKVHLATGRLILWLGDPASIRSVHKWEGNGFPLKFDPSLADLVRCLWDASEGFREVFNIRNESLDFAPEFPREERLEIQHFFEQRVREATR